MHTGPTDCCLHGMLNIRRFDEVIDIARDLNACHNYQYSCVRWYSQTKVGWSTTCACRLGLMLGLMHRDEAKGSREEWALLTHMAH